ncbi:MAG: ABC transporter ATP-binding protein [Geminicoccaceae bacterium]
MRDLVVEATDLWRSHTVGGQQIHALAGLSLQIRRGEFVAVMGSSGSGKSTLLNVLGCLDRPTAGIYRLTGEDTACLDEAALARLRNRRIGFCFQSYNLLPRGTAVQNVALPLIYAGVGRSRREALARARLVEMGLEERLEHRSTQLSGGQQQRVAIARALVADPDILLADEPTGTLDTKTGQEVMALFQELHRRGRTIVLVTHDPGVAAYAERLVRLHDGMVASDERLVSSGPLPRGSAA